MSDFKQIWFIVPSHVLDLPGITLSFLKVYETIFQFWNKGCDCWLSNESIKERTGIKSSSTISEALQYLETNGLLIRIECDGVRLFAQPENRVRIEDNRVSEERDPPSRKSEPPPLAKSRPNKRSSNKEFNKINNKENYIKEKNVDNSKRQSLFDKFWEEYPQKKAKKKCHEIWKRKRLDFEADLIMEALLNQKQNDAQWKDGYIPNPSTYLNQERWNDELSIDKKSTQQRNISHGSPVYEKPKHQQHNEDGAAFRNIASRVREETKNGLSQAAQDALKQMKESMGLSS